MKTFCLLAATLFVSLSFAAAPQSDAPQVIDTNETASENENFRAVLWTGKNLQVTVMSIPVGGDVGLELHETVDQVLLVEQGEGRVQIGDKKDRVDFKRTAGVGDAALVPAGKWHNLINTGNVPLKIVSIYAPIQHPRGTIHKTQADAEADEH